MSTWKKAISTLATAGLLASMFTATMAAPVLAAGTLSAPTPSAEADGSDTAIVSFGGTADSGDTFKVEVTGGATISAASNTAWAISADKTNAQWTNGGATGSTSGSSFFALTSTKVGSFKVTLYTKPFGGSFAKTAEVTVSFTGVLNTALVTPPMAITSGACAAGTYTDPTDITTASSAPAAAYYGTAKACAWVLLAEVSGGTVNLDITAGLSTWAFSIAPYGLLHDANGAPVTSVTKRADATANVTVDGDSFLAAGVTIYSNGTVGKTTVSWTGTYRGKAYSASDSLTFTGPATGIKITGGDVSKAAPGSYTLGWTATDANGIAVSGSSGDLTAASSKTSVVTVGAVGATTVAYNCVTTGQAVVTLSTKTGVTPAFSASSATITCGAGAPKTVSVSGTAVKVGGISTVTVTVKDKNGLPVQDTGNTVAFATNGGIFIDADTFAILSAPITAATKNGVATIALWAPSVPSTVTVLATTGGVAGTGTVSVTAAGATAASGITARVGTAAYGATTRVAKLGETITWRGALGSASASASVGVYMRSRAADGTWSSIRRWATRTADASGNVTFSYKYTSSKWIQIRFVAEGASTSFLGGVWR